jgi:co-chaperonin GroES (HSP10)
MINVSKVEIQEKPQMGEIIAVGPGRVTIKEKKSQWW